MQVSLLMIRALSTYLTHPSHQDEPFQEYDFIIGLEAAIQLEAVYDMTSHIVDIQSRSVPLFSNKDIKMITTKFILSLEAAHKVSSTALDSIVCSTGSMMSKMMQKLSMRILSIEGIEGFCDNIQGVLVKAERLNFSKIYKCINVDVHFTWSIFH